MSTRTLWRLSPASRAERALTGDGAFRRGGRWNLPGARVIYCADARSLAAMEVLANVRDAPLLFEQAWTMIPIVIAAADVEIPPRVPEDWRATPYSRSTQAFGTEWVRAARSVGLRVPSVVVLGEFNYLLNPAHPEFSKVTVGKAEPFSFDPRFKA